MIWHLLTGEYPPRPGGVGDYTRLLAAALADAGREVHVWTPSPGAEAGGPSVTVHQMEGVHGAALRESGRRLDEFPAPRRILVQYAPQAWGLRGMNLPFARWVLARRRAGDDVRVMFHEPFVRYDWRHPKRNVLAAATHLMARTLLRASSRAYVSTVAWTELLQPLAPRGLELRELAIPSTIPVVDDPHSVAALRRRLAGDGPLVAHFGTYGGHVAPMLMEVLPRIVDLRPDARFLLLGNGGPAFADRLIAHDPRFGGRVIAPGYLPPEDTSIHLQASGVAIQPYPDGATTRRTTLMACIANGVPTVSTRGQGSTDLMFSRSIIHAAPLDFNGQANAAVAMLSSASIVIESGDLAEYRAMVRDAYERLFSMDRTVERLLADEAAA